MCRKAVNQSFNHDLGPAKEKARSPKTVLNLGFSYWAVVADRKPEQPDDEETGSRTSLRYGGQRPVSTICIRRHSLYQIRASTGSQCSWRNQRCGGVGSDQAPGEQQHFVHVAVWLLMTSQTSQDDVQLSSLDSVNVEVRLAASLYHGWRNN